MMKRSWMFLLAAVLALPLALGADDGAIVRRIYVTRHGQPDMKRERKSYNRRDPLLSPLGLKQASMLGKYLKSQNFNGKIYASPYLRTVETAVFIGKELGLPVYPEACIQERVSAGGGKSPVALPNLPSGGCSLAKLREIFGDGIAPDAALVDDWLYKQFEDRKVAHVARIRKGLNQLLAAQPTGDLLLVCHAGSVGGLNDAMTPAGGAPIKGTAWNCCLFVYGQKADGSLVQIGYVEPETYLAKEDISSNRKYKANPEAEAELKKPKKN